MTDEEIISSILIGGKQEDMALAFIYNNETYRSNAKKIYNSYKNIKLKTWLDIFHDSIIQLVKSICMGKYLGDNAILVFFKGIYRNKCKEALRLSTGKRATLELPPQDIADLQSPLDIILSEGLKELLREVIARLDTKCKDLLTLWSERYSMKEITQQMKLSSERIAITYNARCKKRLVKLIAEDTQIEKALKDYRWI